ncbi:MAG: SCO family protein [Gammaproteobacteria bacterium]|nr:SCO family protein [Gammaproteobacteria bacterium]
MYGLAAAVAVAAGVFAARVGLFAPPAATLHSGVMLAKPRPVGEFALTRDDGRPFTRADLAGRWTVVFAGFTHCPDVCPNTLGLLKAAQTRLGPVADRLRVLFLSVDPERDTPERLASYVHYFSPSFVGATGPAAELDKLCAALGVAYAKVPGGTPETYTLDHSAALVLVDPQGQVAGYLSPPFKLEALVDDLRRVLERAA